MDKKRQKYKSIRIPIESYDFLKQLSQQNHRSIIAEIMLILEEKAKQKSNLEIEISEREYQERLKAMNELCGIVDDLPAADYTSTIDEVLYRDDEP